MTVTTPVGGSCATWAVARGRQKNVALKRAKKPMHRKSTWMLDAAVKMTGAFSITSLRPSSSPSSSIIIITIIGQAVEWSSSRSSLIAASLQLLQDCKEKGKSLKKNQFSIDFDSEVWSSNWCCFKSSEAAVRLMAQWQKIVVSQSVSDRVLNCSRKKKKKHTHKWKEKLMLCSLEEQDYTNDRLASWKQSESSAQTIANTIADAPEAMLMTHLRLIRWCLWWW